MITVNKTQSDATTQVSLFLSFQVSDGKRLRFQAPPAPTAMKSRVATRTTRRTGGRVAQPPDETVDTITQVPKQIAVKRRSEQRFFSVRLAWSCGQGFLSSAIGQEVKWLTVPGQFTYMNCSRKYMANLMISVTFTMRAPDSCRKNACTTCLLHPFLQKSHGLEALRIFCNGETFQNLNKNRCWLFHQREWIAAKGNDQFCALMTQCCKKLEMPQSINNSKSNKRLF